MLSAAICVPGVARAAVDDPEHTVQGVSPRGTTINVFDYWIEDRNSPDNKKVDDFENKGINAGHALKFGWHMGPQSNASLVDATSINRYTTSAKPRQGIVSNLLKDGYPVLSDATNSSNESLSYLFNNDENVTGKAAYMNVGGLLQVDADGYYYYNSRQNFAQFNDDNQGSGNFTLYDTWAVKTGGSSPDGQFFPFNNGIQVFKDPTDGKEELERKNLKSTASVINHYFGLNMSTRFVQQDGGHTAPAEDDSRKEVTYNFSGDDDVWIYIDGVLVGDLGGIHDKTSIEINFATGKVYIYEDSDNDNVYDEGEQLYNGDDGQTIADIMKDAGITKGFSGNTFADDTYHTLDFFYLERGNDDSNMSLKYNLVAIPETNIQKVDQQGNPVPEAEFNVYKSDESYDYDSGADSKNLICTATTDGDGNVVLVDGNNKPITVDDLWQNGVRYLVFDEVKTPEGYRNTSPIHMRLEQLKGRAGESDTSVVLLSSNQWTTGAYALPRVTLTAPDEITVDGDSIIDPNTNLLKGTLVAVIEKRGDGDDEWNPVYGDHVTGWHILDGATDTNIQLAAEESHSAFVVASGGSYQTELAGLPGRIQQYYWFTDAYEYRISFYYSEDSSLEQAKDFKRVDEQDSFTRQFSATLYVPDILNRFIVQKTDETGNPVEGAEFKLYSADSVNDNDNDGVYVLNKDAKPVDTQTTGTLTTDKNSIDMDGAAVFSKLTKGVYWLQESSAPSGYNRNEKLTKIIVNESGVYADAGTNGDGIEVSRGLGRIVRSMVQFATADDIDQTLHNVIAYKQMGTSEGDEAYISWGDANKANALHLTYADDGDAVLDYTPSEPGGELYYTVDSGIPTLSVRQCRIHSGSDSSIVQNLGDTDISSLFTGTTVVHVTNRKNDAPKVGALAVTKVVTGAGADTTDQFSFTVTLSYANGKPLAQDEAAKAGMRFVAADGQSQAASVNNKGEITFTLSNGQTAYITNIPVDVSYAVTEAKSDGYTPSYDGHQNGSILQGQTAHTTVTNKAEPYTPSGPDPSEPSTPDVDKTLTGRDMVGGEFSFVIETAGEYGSSVSPKSLTGTSDANGKVTFNGGFTFTQTGEYKFTVSEKLPTDDDPDTDGVQHNGVTYDQTTYTVIAHVTNPSGKLQVTWEVEGGNKNITFKNSYEPSGTAKVSLGAKKVLNGRDLKEGEFTFQLKNRAGEVIQTVTNAADGSVVFDAIEFTEPGTYTYYISEVAGDDDQISYDGSTVTVVVSVVDNGDGTLTATVTYNGSNALPTFVNTYSDTDEPGEPEEPGQPEEPGEPEEPGQPEEPGEPGEPGEPNEPGNPGNPSEPGEPTGDEPSIPQTGDNTLLFVGGLVIVAIVFISAGIFLRKRSNR